jgi:EamA domain-containing membrane protein RarD
MALRETVAFSVTPGLIPLTTYLYVLIARGPEAAKRSGVVYAMLIILAYSMALLIGIPAYRALKRRNFLKLWHFSLAGALIGCLPVVAIVLGARRLNLGALELFGLGACAGAVTTSLFWVLALYGTGSTGPNNALQRTGAR